MIGWKENKGADPDIENVPEPDPNLVGSEFRNPSNLSLYLGIYTYKTSFKKINNLDHLIREKKFWSDSNSDLVSIRISGCKL